VNRLSPHDRNNDPATTKARRNGAGAWQSPLFIALFAAVFLLTAVRLSSENQLLLSLGLLALLCLAGGARNVRPDWSRVAVILAGTYVTLRYWMFRTTETLGYHGGWDFTFLMLLYLAETYGIAIHLMGMFVNIAPLTRKIPPLPGDPDRLPTVDVFIPTYDEAVEVVYVTAAACTHLDYPKEKLNIYILDDGGTAQKLNDPDPRRAAAARRRVERLKSMAFRLGLNYLARETNQHAKAGNINEGLLGNACAGDAGERDKAACVNTGFSRSRGELILILDCDHVPTQDLLRNTVGFFLEDEKLFLVQTPHFFINPTPIEKNLDTHRRSPNENEMFYGAVQLGLDFWNSSFFCGSAALLRRSALVEIGGVCRETVTEDAETSLELHGKGYNSVYLNKPMSMGLSPESFEDFILQRSRWAQGMTQILLLKNPLRRKGLRLAQRICYFNSCLFWLFGFARVVFFVSPLMFLFFGMRVYNASLDQILLYAVPHVMASYYVANHLYGRMRHPFFSEIFETIQSIFLAPAVLSVFLNPRRPTFKVTPKTISRSKDSLTPLSAPFYGMFLLAVAGYLAGAWRWVSDPQLWDTVLVCSIWNTFNLLLTLCCLGVVWERRQLRRSHRHETREPIAIRLTGSGTCMAATVTDLSTTGAGLTTEEIFDIPGDRITLEAEGCGRHRFILPARVIRRDCGPSGMILGCEFEQLSEAQRREVIGFVYGDSRRLKYFHEAAIGRKLSSFKGFINLLAIGGKGSLRNAAGVARIFLDFAVRLIVKYCKFPPIDRKGPLPDETLQGVDASGHIVAPGYRYGRGGHPAHPPQKTGPGAGSPVAGVDGQLQLHPPRPRTLESPEGDAPLQLR
jgi:cellulose synthase (UDP-forming)